MGLGGIKLAEYADPRAVSRGVGIAANAASIVDRRVRRSDDVSVVTGRVLLYLSKLFLKQLKTI